MFEPRHLMHGTWTAHRLHLFQLRHGGIMPREGVLSQATRIDPVPADHEALDSLRAQEGLSGGELVLRTADGTEISLPSSLLRLVVSAVNNLAAGRAVMAIPAEVMLTPAEAAELLGLSRPFVARLLERGDIPSELLPESRHRRIKLEDVLAFQDRRERRSEGRRRIADIAASADLPYLCLLFVAKVFIERVRPVSVLCHGSHARAYRGWDSRRDVERRPSR
jgi:excisionase family DNA binding protein